MIHSHPIVGSTFAAARQAAARVPRRVRRVHRRGGTRRRLGDVRDAGDRRSGRRRARRAQRGVHRVARDGRGRPGHRPRVAEDRARRTCGDDLHRDQASRRARRRSPSMRATSTVRSSRTSSRSRREGPGSPRAGPFLDRILVYFCHSVVPSGRTIDRRRRSRRDPHRSRSRRLRRIGTPRRRWSVAAEDCRNRRTFRCSPGALRRRPSQRRSRPGTLSSGLPFSSHDSSRYVSSRWATVRSVARRS